MKVSILKFNIILFSLICLISTDDNNFIRIKAVDCWHNKSFTANVSCIVKAYRSVSVINAEGWAIKPISNIYASMEIFRKTTVTYRPFLVNATANACSLVSGASQSFYAQFMFKWLNEKSVTNVLHPCPQYGYYYMRNLTPVPERLPMLVPPGNYRVDVNLWVGPRQENNALLKVRGTGTVSYLNGVI